MAFSCQNSSSYQSHDQELFVSPKLVVGIVVDQMRYDYLTRFWDDYGQNGFRRLVANGFTAKNHHFDYIQTLTGPGHASVATGTTPRFHGIIANDWFDKDTGSSVYCVEDAAVQSVGTDSSYGQKSPHRLQVATLADQNRLHTQFLGKTISVSIKDRAAILSGGHTANAAYWFYGKNEGRWITSSFYRDSLPSWVQQYNQSGFADEYVKQWDLLYDASNYTESDEDNSPYEQLLKGKKAPVFPYDLEALKSQNDGYSIISETPYGNTMTTDFAIKAIQNEALGQDEITDFLTVSYSSTDYIGHNFGVNSIEIQDTYLRLDQDIARLLSFLDNQVGANEYTLYLTSDHGVSHVPSFLKDVQIPAGYFNGRDFKKQLKMFAKNTFGDAAVLKNISNKQLFLDHTLLALSGISLQEATSLFVEEIYKYSGISRVYTSEQIMHFNPLDKIQARLLKGYHPKRSGDVWFVLEPNTISYSPRGTTHGSGYSYDTHAPLIFYGKGIKKGMTSEPTYISDISPTIASLLGIATSSSSTGNVIAKALD
jgi:predicted AlkP superfamily pyrophosphatase or phosphodiesterase